MIDRRGFNSEMFQTILQQMVKYSRRKVFFVTDGHLAYKTKKLKAWPEVNQNSMEVFFLPPCSPQPDAQE